ncbi:MAG: hypothetical protein J0H68_09885 [Sphingobacteriia bacterium]|nr:hypothetical protein [Sphingobacteriia bacterium]
MTQHYKVNIHQALKAVSFYDTALYVPKYINITFTDENNSKFSTVIEYSYPEKSGPSNTIKVINEEIKGKFTHITYSNDENSYKLHEIIESTFNNPNPGELFTHFQKENNVFGNKNITKTYPEVVNHQSDYIYQNFNITKLDEGIYFHQENNLEFDYVS